MFNFENWKPQEIQREFNFMNKVQTKKPALYRSELLYAQIRIHRIMDRFIFVPKEVLNDRK